MAPRIKKNDAGLTEPEAIDWYLGILASITDVTDYDKVYVRILAKQLDRNLQLRARADAALSNDEVMAADRTGRVNLNPVFGELRQAENAWQDKVRKFMADLEKAGANVAASGSIDRIVPPRPEGWGPALARA